MFTETLMIGDIRNFVASVILGDVCSQKSLHITVIDTASLKCFDVSHVGCWL